MLYVALRMLWGDKIKYLSLIGGVAFASLLIAQQASILSGLTYQTGATIRNTTGAFDLWVMDPEVEFSEESKPMPDTTPDRVRSVEGVEWAVPMYRGRRQARLPDGTLKTVALVGIDDATLLGGPPTMAEGTLASLREDKAVLLDAAELEKNFSIQEPGGARRPMRLGDSFSINDQAVTVTGTFRKEKSFFWEPVIYTTYTRALTIAPRERKLLTFVLVKAKAGQDLDALAARIRETTGQKALRREDFLSLTGTYVLFKTGILINFAISVGLGFVIGVLVSAQTFYNFILDNLRHFGVLKAIGVSNRMLVVMVAAQVLLVGGIGYGVGIGLASLMGDFFLKGGLAFKMIWEIPVFTAATILTVSLIAGALSLARVLRLEPAVVFRS